MIVEFAPRHRIEAGGGFVEQQQLRPRRQRQRQAQLGAGAARHLGGAEPVRYVEQAQQALKFGAVPGRVKAADELAELIGVHPRIKLRFLAHIADALLEACRHALDGLAEHADVAAVGPEQSHQQFQGGGLAGAVAAEEAEHFSLAHGETQAVQGLHLAVTVGQVDQFDCIHGGGGGFGCPIIKSPLGFLSILL